MLGPLLLSLPGAGSSTQTGMAAPSSFDKPPHRLQGAEMRHGQCRPSGGGRQVGSRQGTAGAMPVQHGEAAGRTGPRAD